MGLLPQDINESPVGLFSPLAAERPLHGDVGYLFRLLWHVPDHLAVRLVMMTASFVRARFRVPAVECPPSWLVVNPTGKSPRKMDVWSPTKVHSLPPHRGRSSSSSSSRTLTGRQHTQSMLASAALNLGTGTRSVNVTAR